MLAGLRWKAVTKLTDSLSEFEREALLKTSEPGPKVNDMDIATSSKPSVSIEEAVAAAVLKEQQRLSGAADEAVALAVKNAEEAANSRVQAELSIIRHRKLAFEAWQVSISQEAVCATMLRPGSTDDLNSQSSVNPPSTSNEEESEAPQAAYHPVLGPCLADLGTKRIFLASAKALASIPVWNQQRIYRHDRAKSMAADKLKTSHLGLLGVIALYENDKTGSLCIIDGQHRVGMMSVLESKHGMELDRVLVEVYSPTRKDNDSVDHEAAIFEEINKAEPVKLVDMPGILKARDRSTLNGGVERFSERFAPEMFSTSSRCRAPHLNLDLMRDAIFAANAIERHQLKTAKALEGWLLDQNERLKMKFTDDEASRLGVTKHALAKAQKHGLYLGLDSSWYHA
jgi:hypothetical protein